jgi:hypothetical protein
MQTFEPVTPIDCPALYIAAPRATTGSEQPRVYEFSLAPTYVFNAWVNTILDAEDDLGDPLFLMIIKGHRETWDAVARWWFISALALKGVDVAKYYFESR